MSQCPVCKKESTAIVCPDCGFDRSCHYEAYPTLFALTGKIDAVSKRIAARTVKPRMDLLQCPNCKNNAFSIELRTRRHVCLQCGTSLTSLEFEQLLMKQQKIQSGTEALIRDVSAQFKKAKAAEAAHSVPISAPSKPAPVPHLVAIGIDAAALLHRDGTVSCTASPFSHAQKWQDIISIAAMNNCLIGLHKNGKMSVVGTKTVYFSSISAWKDVVDMDAGNGYVVVLTADGKVRKDSASTVALSAINGWRDIAAISAGAEHVVGLKQDGTVVATGNLNGDRCKVGAWRNIVAISAGSTHTVGLKQDGTVIAVGLNSYGQCHTENWKDIVAVSAGTNHTLGLRRDGTVVAAGGNFFGQCQVSEWKDVEAIYAGQFCSVGIQKDGTILMTGDFRQSHVRIGSMKR